MSERTDLFTPPLADRTLLALTRITMTAERRDGFFSDDDVLDAVCEFTTEPIGVDDPVPAEWGDYRCLCDAVWMAVEAASEREA